LNIVFLIFITIIKYNKTETKISLNILKNDLMSENLYKLTRLKELDLFGHNVNFLSKKIINLKKTKKNYNNGNSTRIVTRRILSI